MYGLELKGGTSLRTQVDAGVLPRPDDDVFADMYEHASHRLESMDMLNTRLAIGHFPSSNVAITCSTGATYRTLDLVLAPMASPEAIAIPT